MSTAMSHSQPEGMIELMGGQGRQIRLPPVRWKVAGQERSVASALAAFFQPGGQRHAGLPLVMPTYRTALPANGQPTQREGQTGGLGQGHPDRLLLGVLLEDGRP